MPAARWSSSINSSAAPLAIVLEACTGAFRGRGHDQRLILHPPRKAITYCCVQNRKVSLQIKIRTVAPDDTPRVFVLSVGKVVPPTATEAIP